MADAPGHYTVCHKFEVNHDDDLARQFFISKSLLTDRMDFRNGCDTVIFSKLSGKHEICHFGTFCKLQPDADFLTHPRI